MAKEYWTINEVIEIFQVDAVFLSNLEEQEVLCPTCTEGTRAKQFSTHDLEKLRLAKLLVEDMEVNLPGVEIILRMRQNMLEMRKQFDTILEELAHYLKKDLQNHT